MAPGRCCVSACVFLVFVLVVQSADVEFVQKPGIFYPIEDETLAVTCSAEGPVSKLVFLRQDELGIRFVEMTNTQRVYTTNKTEGNLATSVLHFKTVKVSDDSASQRYACWVYSVNNTNDVLKIDFHVNVIAKDLVPKAHPDTAVVLDKRLGDYVELKCNITTPGKNSKVELKSLHWKKNDEIIETVYTQDGEFKQKLGGLKFTSISLGDAGNYSCVMETVLRMVKKLNITAGPFIVNIIPEFREKKVGSSIKAKKGQAVSFTCSAVGYPLSIEWKLRLKYETTWNTIEKSPCNESHHCINSKGNRLEIADVQYSDRGIYNCCIVNENSTDSDCQQFVLRVRDPLGPLWPVIGIVIEIILLFVIIYFTQKKQNTKAAAAKTDGRAEFSYSSTDDGDRGQVRLRAAADKPKET